MFDARRMEVYTALFDHELNEVRTTDAIVMDTTFCAEIAEKIIYFGPGAEKCREILSTDRFEYAQVEVSAVGMAQLAEQQFNSNKFVDVAYFEPAYLKDFVAGKPKKII
jgi:tRNA threonylcarbamoyladenosine biosynthesis protein TsaB